MRIGFAGMVAMSMALVGCGGKPEADNVAQAANANGEDSANASNAASATASFDIGQIPTSTAELGEFPYFSLPAGYTNERRDSVSKDFARFPFWVKGQPVWVEGRFYGTSFTPVDGKDMSEYEVRKNFESLITSLGGKRVSEEKIPSDTVRSWGDEIQMGFLAGLGDVYNSPATTYVIRRDDGNIWVHLVTNSAQGWYLVGQEKGFEQTASLIPADRLKQAIDRDGKATVQVNFATDAADILPASQPQIDAISTLLNDDAKLRLAINGHTDDTGDAGKNQSLSERRAASVRQALVGKGIAAGRLTAKGFGSTAPLADNDSEDGKAKNRRVELVRL